VICHHHRRHAPKRRDLVRVELRRAQQARDQDDGQSFLHDSLFFREKALKPKVC
jgi:hypothetical protein